MVTHSSILVWKIPWAEEPLRLQCMGSQSGTRLSDFTSPHSVPCRHQIHASFPGPSRLYPTSKPLRRQVPPPATLSRAPSHCQTHGPTRDRLSGLTPGPGFRHVSRRHALRALASGGVRMVRAQGTSAYLRRIPQRRRRHRTLWAEQDRERRERRREVGTAGAIRGLARGSPDGVAELETRLCALPPGPS